MDSSICHQTLDSNIHPFGRFTSFIQSLTLNKCIVTVAQILIIPWGLFTLHFAAIILKVCYVPDEAEFVFLGVVNIFAALLGAVLYWIRSEDHPVPNKTKEALSKGVNASSVKKPGTKSRPSIMATAIFESTQTS
jgi:hypothetical protein